MVAEVRVKNRTFFTPVFIVFDYVKSLSSGWPIVFGFSIIAEPRLWLLQNSIFWLSRFSVRAFAASKPFENHAHFCKSFLFWSSLDSTTSSRNLSCSIHAREVSPGLSCSTAHPYAKPCVRSLARNVSITNSDVLVTITESATWIVFSPTAWTECAWMPPSGHISKY